MSQQDYQQAKNERISTVLKMLKEGLPRQEIADQFGYSTWKSLDIYMRRHGFSWDAQRHIYTFTVPELPSEKEQVIKIGSPSVNPDEIVRLFGMGLLDPREIAKKTGFTGHKEMAAYMLRNGYIWSSESHNYISSQAASSKGILPTSADLNNDSNGTTLNLIGGSKLNSINKYISLLEFLWESREKLLKIIDSIKDENRIRIFNIPGKGKTKSIFLSDNLADLMSAFCQEHSLSQRQGYETALVEYLMKYGYQNNVNQLLYSQEESENSQAH